MAQDYFNGAMHALDRDYYSKFWSQLDSFGPVEHPLGPHVGRGQFTTGLSPQELGSTVNPMINQIAALQAKMREGASRLEIGFGGVGKGNSQMATPEAYGEIDRETLRQLAEYNDVKTSTHASFQLAGLAGFGREGFSRQAQQVMLEEVKKAVDFAAQATTGGAVVVHTGEWQRPISEADWSTKDFKKQFGDKPAFSGYLGEASKAVIPVVDKRTGAMVSDIRKDQELYEPEWLTVDNYEKLTGRKLAATDVDGNPVDISKVGKFAYVDEAGRVVDPLKQDESEYRTPFYDAKSQKFATRKVTWDTIVARTEDFNRVHGTKRRPEEIFALTQIDNRILDSKANKYYLGNVEAIRRQAEYLAQQEHDLQGAAGKDKTAEEKLAKVRFELEDLNERMRRATQVQSSADVQEKQFQALKENIETMENYGLQQSGAALSELGLYAMERSNKMMAEARKRGSESKFEKIYIAPENVFSEQYGSHPDELMKIVQAGRDQMVAELTTRYGKSKEEAQEMARDHIKSTLDIGHLNMWKKHMEHIPGETDEAFHKRFETWAMGKIQTMHEKKMLGHFHLTDNLGFNDEHLTPGQGNAPIRPFVKKLAELGYKDFIAEIGSFNAGTILGDTWSYLGASHFTQGSQFGRGNFNNIQSRHFGGYAPPMYIVGSYSPSNEFTLWSQVPLE